jgi:hypothetical protein
MLLACPPKKNDLEIRSLRGWLLTTASAARILKSHTGTTVGPRPGCEPTSRSENGGLPRWGDVLTADVLGGWRSSFGCGLQRPTARIATWLYEHGSQMDGKRITGCAANAGAQAKRTESAPSELDGYNVIRTKTLCPGDRRFPAQGNSLHADGTT